ncbi:MAG: hypothetical protein JSV88_09065, partial [Candidatus Aminicenantes bacterium]
FMQELKMLKARHKKVFNFFAICFSGIILFVSGCKIGEENPINNNGGNNHVFSDQWVELGPAPIGGDTSAYTGRVAAIGVSASNPELYYVGGADGGVWKSENGGASWKPLTDHLPTTAIGAIAVDPTNDQVVYAGSGEANFANHSRYGLGLYKTTDGGENWEVLAADVFSGRCFSRIVIDPDNTNILYASITHAGGLPSFDFNIAAARGHDGAQLPLGIWKSPDGGNTWSQLTNGIPGDLSATDLVIDPSNSSILYAGIGHVFGDLRNGIYKSIDGGTSWNRLDNGLPDTEVGRIALAATPANPNRIYASIVRACDATGGGASTLSVYRSDDGGLSWVSRYPGSIHATYGWYLNVIAASPSNPDIAFVGGLRLYRTFDGGDSWLDAMGNQHVDFHALSFDAQERLLSGNDGGVYRSSDLGDQWTVLNNGLGIVQFYAGISVDPNDPSTIYGGSQDNGTIKKIGNGKEDWVIILGGDGGCTGIKPDDSSVVFAEYQRTGNLFKSVQYGANLYRSASGINPNDPNCFVPPYDFDPNNPDHMYYATHRFYKSTNSGNSWTPISGDLTGGNGAAIRGFTIAPSNPATIYAGTNDGRILVSFDRGNEWELQLIDIPGWPRIMRQFAVAPSDHLTTYLAVSYFGVDQVLMTQDGGENWISLDNNLSDIPVNTICLDPRYGLQVLYIGTDSGVYRSTDGGNTWARYGQGLPNCTVNDMKIDTFNDHLIAATQGRGMWMIDIE